VDLLDRLRQLVKADRSRLRGARLVVAVSGGVDSVVLLQLLHQLAPELGCKLSVAHLNHRLRGRAAAADAAFVERVARKLGLPCDVGSADVNSLARQENISIEMAARKARHAFLAQCAHRRRARFIALAHHADDQVELFFLRLMRGASGEGMGGMRRLSPSPVRSSVTLWRPLLDLSKAELLAWAQSQQISFREDATNHDLDMERNWLRQELLPRLQARQPGFSAAVLRTMEVVGAEAELVAALADEWRLGESKSPFAALPLALQRRVLQRQIVQLGFAADFSLVEALRVDVGKTISAGPGVWLRRDSQGVVQPVKESPLKLFKVNQRVLRLKADVTRGKVRFAGGELRWRLLARPDGFKPTAGSGVEWFDADKVGRRVVLRHWQAGDRFQPIGFANPTKLQDWFTNRKVPLAERHALVLAADERGGLFWVEGQRIGETAKVTAATRRLLEWRWVRR
jgi:tRNA(Ile)-lysidine synthase